MADDEMSTVDSCDEEGKVFSRHSKKRKSRSSKRERKGRSPEPKRRKRSTSRHKSHSEKDLSNSETDSSSVDDDLSMSSLDKHSRQKHRHHKSKKRKREMKSKSKKHKSKKSKMSRKRSGTASDGSTSNDDDEKKSIKAMEHGGNDRDKPPINGPDGIENCDQVKLPDSSKQENNIDSVQNEGRRKIMAPMSREQYEKEQSVIREVYDDESGRWRLVRGSGEIIERIVSRDDHHRINQRATKSDGSSFSKNIYHALHRR